MNGYGMGRRDPNHRPRFQIKQAGEGILKFLLHAVVSEAPVTYDVAVMQTPLSSLGTLVWHKKMSLEC